MIGPPLGAALSAAAESANLLGPMTHAAFSDEEGGPWFAFDDVMPEARNDHAICARQRCGLPGSDTLQRELSIHGVALSLSNTTRVNGLPLSLLGGTGGTVASAASVALASPATPGLTQPAELWSTASRRYRPFRW